MSSLWPNFESVSDRAVQCLEASANGEDIKKFATSGTDIPVKKQARKMSPSKANSSFVN